MIAIALCSHPKLLIADEPTTALDVTIQDQVMKLLNSLKRELDMSVILVTHDLAVVAQMCDNVAVMYAGIVVEKTDVVTLFAKPRHPYTYALMGSIPDQSKVGSDLEVIQGNPPNLANLPRVARSLHDAAMPTGYAKGTARTQGDRERASGTMPSS